MWPNHDTQTAAGFVYVVPPLWPGRPDRRPEVFPRPAREAVDALVSFTVDSSLRNLFTVARPRPKRRQAELPLEGPGPAEELLVVPSGRVDPKGLGVDFVDRNVDVLVIRIVVAHRNVLMLGKPQSIHKPIHNSLELLSFEAPIVGVK